MGLDAHTRQSVQATQAVTGEQWLSYCAGAVVTLCDMKLAAARLELLQRRNEYRQYVNIQKAITRLAFFPVAALKC